MDDSPRVLPEHGAEAAREVFELNRTLLDKHQITSDYLAKKLKKELNAKVTRLLVVKSAGKYAEGEEEGGNGSSAGGHNGTGKTKKLWEGETILSQHGSYHHEVHAVDHIDWSTRQRARQDAHKLRGDYPAEKVKHSGAIQILAPEPITKPSNAGRAEPD